MIEVPDAAALASWGAATRRRSPNSSRARQCSTSGQAGASTCLSAQRVGRAGHVYGLDMTPEMLGLAERNAAEAGEQCGVPRGPHRVDPTPGCSVDVIISNCVINLSPDKPAVFSEMFRVFRPGGRIGVSDVVTEDQLTEAERLERGSSSGASPALPIGLYVGARSAGFTEVAIGSTNKVADGVHSAI